MATMAAMAAKASVSAPTASNRAPSGIASRGIGGDVSKVSGVTAADQDVDVLVLDTAAFIRLPNPGDLKGTLYTVRDVIGEVREKAARERLARRTYELHFREPSDVDILAGESKQ